jgi:NADPH:quinone reductase-like Zn-dependent oxidoreductase
MRALRFARYGPPEVLRVEDVPERDPAAGEAKVRVHAVALNPLDWKIRKGELRLLPMLRPPPRGSGVDFCGEIVAVGGGAQERHVGERVLGSLSPFGRDGALADYLIAPLDRLVRAAESLDDAHAAALPTAGGTALQALTDEAHVQGGQRVLVTGAAGGVGHFAVQIARRLGAHVAGVCGPDNVAFVRELGADDVVDYTREDFTRRMERFDVVFDAAGASSFAAARRVMTDTGCYINTLGNANAFLATVPAGLAARLTSRQRSIALFVRNDARLWKRLVELASAGAIRPHVERTIALDAVADAQRAMESGHGRGKVVVRLS